MMDTISMLSYRAHMSDTELLASQEKIFGNRRAESEHGVPVAMRIYILLLSQRNKRETFIKRREEVETARDHAISSPCPP